MLGQGDKYRVQPTVRTRAHHACVGKVFVSGQLRPGKCQSRLAPLPPSELTRQLMKSLVLQKVCTSFSFHSTHPFPYFLMNNLNVYIRWKLPTKLFSGGGADIKWLFLSLLLHTIQISSRHFFGRCWHCWFDRFTSHSCHVMRYRDMPALW